MLPVLEKYVQVISYAETLMCLLYTILITGRLDTGLPIDALSDASPKTCVLAEYLRYVHVRLTHLPKSKRLAHSRAPRKWAFKRYQDEQRAAEKLCLDLRTGFDKKTSVVVVWGNGGFGPTSRGHAPAPNKKLQRMISRHFPIVTSSEYRSSQRAPCCKSSVHGSPGHREKHGNSKRDSVLFCDKCNGIFARDMSAACVILDIFEFQCEHQTSRLPPYITNKLVHPTMDSSIDAEC